MTLSEVNRRAFVKGLGAVLALPRAADAQPVRIPRVGVLLFGTPDTDAFPIIRRGLRALGYIEGQNIVFEHRYAEGRPERLPDLASDLVRSKPDVIIAAGGDVAPFAKRATATIPIVMITSADPVQGGLVASLARPAGNVTGVTFVSSELAGKRLQFLKEAAPSVTRVAVLWIALAAQNRLPLASGWGPWAAEGGLFSYGPDLDAVIRSAAIYVDRIVKGARPGDIPVERPTKFALVINLKTAKALGLTIPPSLLLRADQVIE